MAAARASPTDALPSLVVFDLDWTLWPLDVDVHVDAPFSRAPAGHVTDRRGRAVSLFADTRRVLHYLRARGVAVAYASRTTDAEAAEALLKTVLLLEPGHIVGGGAGATEASVTNETTLWDLLPSRAHFQAYPSGGGGRAKSRHFAHIVAAAKVEAHEILFFDDAPDKVEVASQAGIVSVLLEGGKGITWSRFERGLAEWRRQSAAKW